MRPKTEPRVSAAGGLRARGVGSAVAATAWGVLFVLSMLRIINHVLGAAAFASSDDERMMFALFAGVNLYATVVLLTAYRRDRLREGLTWLHPGDQSSCTNESDECASRLFGRAAWIAGRRWSAGSPTG